MKRMIFSHCFLVTAGFFLLSPSVSLGQTTITCMPGNPTLQDTPLFPMIDEGQCNGDIGCLVNVRQQNAQLLTRNNALTAQNTVKASQRAQCDAQLAALAQQQAAAKAAAQQQMLQNLAKALPSGGGGGGNGSGDKKNGDNNGGGDGKNLDTGKDDGQGKANDAAKASIESSAQALAKVSGLQGGQAVTSALQKYKSARASCVGDQDAAATACNSENSPAIANSSLAVTGTPDTVNGNQANGSSVAAGQIDNHATDGLNNFIADCRPKNESCTSSCGDANKALDELKQAAQATSCPDKQNHPACDGQKASNTSKLNDGISKEKNAGDKTAVAGKEKTCKEKNTATLKSAMDGLGKILQALGTAMAANQATAPASMPTIAGTSDCNTPDPTTGLLPQTPECICASNPRAGGCASAGANGSASAASMAGLGSDASSSTGGVTTLPSAGGPPDLPPLDAREASANSPGGSAGGSPIGGGGSFGGSGSAGGGGADGHKPLDANILAGMGGGGSGGGGWGSGGGSGDEKYRDYLPGGKRDPASLGAASAAWAREVSGQGGKSNWDKVKERYRDSNPTFIMGN